MARCRIAMFGPVFALVLTGCDQLGDRADRSELEPAVVAALAAQFDAADCGTVCGHVTWLGPTPVCPPFEVTIQQPDGRLNVRRFANPNAPHIDSASKGVQGAVIFLEFVQPARSRKWDHSACQVRIREEQIRVVQGNLAGQIGFVHIGDEIEMVSCQASFNLLSVRGSAFFALAFPEPDRPLRRKLTKSGVIELTSGAAKYWHQAYLFVCEHPYFALTDLVGHFDLPKVPAGEYRLHCWLPDSNVIGRDRDPNTGAILRVHYAPPMHQVRPVQVLAGHSTRIDFVLKGP